MPRRALRCVVDLKIRAVTAPGVWLPSREDVYLSISLFGQYRNTNLIMSVFPLFMKEDFRFEKTYYTALDPSEVSEYLEDELIIFELLQLSPFGGANRLASYSCNARDFLFPYPSLAPCYASTAREILLERTIDFPGISPKLEFVTVTNIKESLSPELDALEDELEAERRSRRRSRSRSRSRSRMSMRTYLELDPEEDDKSYHKPTISSICRSRSPSPALRRSLTDSFSPKLSSVESRPPFVVRHLENSLIGRTPVGLAPGKKKSKRRSRSLTRRPSSALSDSGDYTSYPSSLTHKYRLRKVMYILQADYASGSDEDDNEVASLTKSIDNLSFSRRPRSVSPLLYRPTLSERYRPLTPSEKLDLDLRVERAIQRSKSRERLAQLDLEESLRRARLNRTLDELDLDTRLSRIRRGENASVHLNNGKYWSDRAAEFQAKSHRQVFNDSLSQIYSRMYTSAKSKYNM
ncbi:hypothetical protein FSP39_008825 [Pinctada imbricata]|uniref:Spermatogenesis-associated protein 6 N-terminal domain-containing protein n=1 Tax=Pinctada imbricata TaxID=66713 RepID=A0AA88XXZ1_PINIB|nr:hypothetical protein FSP39_008825 [Pinctada imbricata]